MRDAGLDVLWLNNEPEFFWLTGFSTAFWLSASRSWHLLLPASGEPVAVIPSIGEASYANTGIGTLRCFDSPHPGSLGVSLLADTLTDIAGTSPVVGRLEGPATWLRVPQAEVHALEQAVPKARWHDATDLVHGLRHIKSDAEIARLRHICGTVSDLYDAVPELLEPGMHEAALFRAVRQHAHALGIDEVPYLVGASGPGGIRDIIAPPTARSLADGDILMLDSGCRHRGYFSDFDRNWAVGHAPPDAAAAYEVAWEATEAGLAAAKPGQSCADLYAAMHRVLAPHDGATGNDVGRLGHGLGIELTESPSLTPHDQALLRPGMVMTLEPALIYGDGFVMVHEENIVITDSGCSLLSRRAPAQLPVI